MASRKAKNAAVLALIAVVAAALSFASYLYSDMTASEATRVAGREAQTNAAIESFQLAKVLETKVEVVAANTQLISIAPLVQSHNVTKAQVFFTNAQNATKDFTLAYFWLDKSGKLTWSNSFSNQTLEKQYNGSDRSTWQYFTQPRDTHRPYYSTLIESADGVPRLFVSYPILNHTNSFNGVIGAAVDLRGLGKYLESQMSPQFNSTVGMLDRNGVIVYSQDGTFLGKNIFGSEVQAMIPDGIKGSFNSFIKDSLAGQSGSGDISNAGSVTTIAYEPVTVNGTFFAVLYISAPHVLASDVNQLISQQRNFNLIVTAVIGAVAVAIGITVVVWNKRLTNLVEKRTLELKKSNEFLVESNSQLEKANEQLLVHDKMQKEFINVAAHELRTPTQAIIGYADLLEMVPEENSQEREEQIRAIARNASRLERLASDILDVTRIESKSLQLQKEKVNLDYLIAPAIKDAKNKVTDGTVKFVYEPTNIVIDADKTRIAQVISNLLGNAVKFTPKGEIVVSATKQGNVVVVQVKDTGEGIDNEILPRLFTKFTTKSQTGTGLGLYICKAIIEAHGGRIWARNNKDRKGATVSFTLPI